MTQEAISQLTTGTPKGTDLTPATDTTDPTQSSSGTTKKYIRSDELNFYLKAQGLNTYQAVRAATTIALTATYANGVLGVGATLTNAGAQAVFSSDGITAVVGDRWLVKDQASTFQNGIYTVTNIGSSSTNWVLTRATDMDVTAEVIQYATVLVNQGTVNAGLLWQQTAVMPVVMGTDPITFALYVTATLVIPVLPSQGGTGVVNSNANTLTISGVSSINQNVTTTGSPVFTSVSPGNLNLSANILSSTNTNGNVTIVPNGTGKILIYPSNTSFTPVVPSLVSETINIVSSTTSGITLSGYFNGGSSAAAYVNYKSRSTTQGVFSALNSGDIITTLLNLGDDGLTFKSSSQIQFTVDGAVSAGIVPGKIRFSTTTAAGTLTSAMTIDATQTVALTNALPLTSGGTGVTSVTTAPTASSWAGWDANSNLSANNHIEGYATTATAAGTTVLTVASPYFQYFTGATTQTVTMPVTSTLVTGQSWFFVNNSSGAVTIQSSGGNTIQVMAGGTALLVTCILTSGTTDASWDGNYIIQGGGVSSITGTANQVIASASTGDITLSLPQSIATSSGVTFGSVTFSTTSGIVGTTTNNDAAAGSVGEFVSSVIPVASAVSMTSTVNNDITSISLTAGDWDLHGNVGYTFSGNYTESTGWISTTSVTLPDLSLVALLYGPVTGSGSEGINVPFKRISVAGTTTVYLSGKAVFSTGTCVGYGGIYARRVR